jgi:hypothetical protein
MHPFHIAIHARPEHVLPGPAWELDGQRYDTLAITANSLDRPLPVSYDQAAERLHRLPRMFLEPDGSFVWVSEDGQQPWQVDGNLFDRRERLLYVELKGTCSREAFDRLLKAFGWPETQLVFQLIRPAVFLDETPFRRCVEFR